MLPPVYLKPDDEEKKERKARKCVCVSVCCGSKFNLN